MHYRRCDLTAFRHRADEADRLLMVRPHELLGLNCAKSVVARAARGGYVHRSAWRRTQSAHGRPRESVRSERAGLR